MKARYSYPLLCLPLSAMFAGIIAVVFVAVAAGAMWIFIYGDNEWPTAADHFVMALSILVFALVLAALLRALYGLGKRREPGGGLTRKHVLVATATTILVPLLIMLRQWSIGATGDHTPYTVPDKVMGKG